MNENVVSFPSKRKKRAETATGDELLVKKLRRAWRYLGHTIDKARAAGLTVETDFYVHNEPKITRKL